MSAGLREWPHGLLKPLLRNRLGRRWDVHVRGLGYVPTDGPVVLASNHVGWLDGPVTVITSDRAVHALTKQESFHGMSGLLLRLGGQIKLDRARRDAGAVRTALRALRAGQVVLVYPEATRGDGLVHSTTLGAAYLALATGAPVVPVCVVGTRAPGAGVETKPDAGQRVDVVYGRALTFEAMPWPRDAAAIAAADARIAEALRVHVQATTDHLKRDLPGPPPEQDIAS